MKDSHHLLIRLLPLSILLFAAASHAANPQQTNRHNINGSVYYGDTGQPAEHVFVDLLTSGGSTMATATTGANGDFQFYDLPPDTYQLSVRLQEYEPLIESVDLSYNSTYGLQLVLRRRGAVSISPNGNSVSAHMLSLPSKAQQAYAAGNEDLYKKNKPADAVTEFNKAVKAAPGFYEAYEALGWAYQVSGRSSDAEDAFRKSIKASNDKYAPADVGLGALLLDTQRLGEAEKTLQQAVALDAKSWRAFYELGRAMLMQEKVAEALKNAEQAKALDPRAPSVYRLLANIHIRLHDNAALLDDLDSYVKLDPSSPAGQRAKAMRDQLAKTIPDATPPPVNHFSAAGVAMPVSQYTSARLD